MADVKPEDLDVLARYIRVRADDLGLRDWTITLLPQPPTSEEVLAECRPTEGRKHATIRVTVGFREDLTDDEQRSVIVHELLHCHLAQVQFLTDSRLTTQLGSGASSEPIRMAIEYAVDGIADAIAEKFPVVPWQTKDPTRNDSADRPLESRVDVAS